jgi:IS30 family transposase
MAWGFSQGTMTRALSRNKGPRGYRVQHAPRNAPTRQEQVRHKPARSVFFAKPSHAWERGVNENTNGLIRDCFPQGTDFSTIPPATVAQVQRLLNSRPRKSLGVTTPTEVFHALATRA